MGIMDAYSKHPFTSQVIRSKIEVKWPKPKVSMNLKANYWLGSTSSVMNPALRGYNYLQFVSTGCIEYNDKGTISGKPIDCNDERKRPEAKHL